MRAGSALLMLYKCPVEEQSVVITPATPNPLHDQVCQVRKQSACVQYARSCCLFISLGFGKKAHSYQGCSKLVLARLTIQTQRKGRGCWQEQAGTGIYALCGARLKEVEFAPKSQWVFFCADLIPHME